MKPAVSLLVLVLACGEVVAQNMALYLDNPPSGVDCASPGSYMRVQDSATLEPQQFTLEAWIQPTGTGCGYASNPAGAAIISKPTQGTGGKYVGSYLLSRRGGDGRTHSRLTAIPTYAGTECEGASSSPVGLPTHIAMTFDGADVRIYFNGQLDTLYPQLCFHGTSVYYGPEQVLVGAAEYSAPFYRRFQGYLDEVRIWDYARSATEIQDQMTVILAGTEPGLRAYWNFDGGSTQDVSGHGNDGQLIGPNATLEPSPFATILSPLSASPSSISVSQGGTQTLFLNAGSGHAGATYAFVGSLTGACTSGPPACVVPVVPDPYTFLILAHPNDPPFSGMIGVLDGSGAATASITLPPGGPVSLVGITAFHAFVLIDAALPGMIGFASNVTTLTFTP